jgi:hypothetical protein
MIMITTLPLIYNYFILLALGFSGEDSLAAVCPLFLFDLLILHHNRVLECTIFKGHRKLTQQYQHVSDGPVLTAFA